MGPFFDNSMSNSFILFLLPWICSSLYCLCLPVYVPAPYSGLGFEDTPGLSQSILIDIRQVLTVMLPVKAGVPIEGFDLS